MTLHESDVVRAMQILHFICDEGGYCCFSGGCPLRGMCRGYQRDDETSPFAVLEDPDTTTQLIQTLKINGLITKG